MPFERYLAIDWSGDRRVLTNKIQVAEYNPAAGTVRLVPSPAAGAGGRWSRVEVFTQVQRWVEESKVLIGFDFAFAYPFCDRGQYFPGHPESPANLRDLWQTVEDVCWLHRNFYGGQFYLPGLSTFSKFHHYRNPRHPCCVLRYRTTDEQARNSGLHPSSVFNCVGQKQVGPGSIAGMRFLRKVRQETNVTVWPFDTTDEPSGSAIVEIYPRLFLDQAEELTGNQPTRSTVPDLLRCYVPTLQGAPVAQTEDERDALVSAAGMGWVAGQPTTWLAPTHASACEVEHEGWIFAVR